MTVSLKLLGFKLLAVTAILTSNYGVHVASHGPVYALNMAGATLRV
jgi:hypothetical protein